MPRILGSTYRGGKIENSEVIVPRALAIQQLVSKLANDSIPACFGVLPQTDISGYNACYIRINDSSGLTESKHKNCIGKIVRHSRKLHQFGSRGWNSAAKMLDEITS